MQKSLAGWLKPASADAMNVDASKPTPSSKRKRISDDENTESAKAQKVIKKTGPKKAAPKKAANGNKEAQQMYKKVIANVDKKVSSLNARVKKMGPNSRAVTSDDYAEAMTKNRKDVEALRDMDARLALNALLYVGPCAHGDLEASMKMAGFGDTKESFDELDELMLTIISKLEVPSADTTNESSLPAVPHHWTRDDANVGVFKTGRPNKQQRGQIERQRAAWIKGRNNAAKERREKTEDWVRIAMEDLKAERDDIKGFGLEDYFAKSIAKLEELSDGRTS